MSDGPARKDKATATSPSRKGAGHLVLVSLSDEQYAAVEGWRAAHGIAGQPEALGELVRIGLLSEIAKIYRLVTEGRRVASAKAGSGERASRRQSRIDG